MRLELFRSRYQQKLYFLTHSKIGNRYVTLFAGEMGFTQKEFRKRKWRKRNRTIFYFTPRNRKRYEIVSIICDYLERFRLNLYERFIDSRPYIALLILNYVGTYIIERHNRWKFAVKNWNWHIKDNIHAVIYWCLNTNYK